MLVVNLFGGPGTGKSTLAASLFAALKMRGVNAELVTEFAKDLVWTERTKELNDQVYILGKMYHKLWRLRDKVDVAVIDSPLPLCIYYDQGRTHGFNVFCMSLFDQFDNFNILLQRNFPYQQEGRYQDEAGAIEVHQAIMGLMGTYGINHIVRQSPDIAASQGEYNSFVQTLVDEILGFKQPVSGVVHFRDFAIDPELEKKWNEEQMKPKATLKVNPDEVPQVLGPGKWVPRDKPRPLIAPPFNPKK